jgi:diacylglycerol kinase family enzyme
VSLSPETTLDSGLGLVTFRSLGLWTLVRTGMVALSRGSVRGQRLVVLATDVDHVRIEGYRSVPFQVDGDFVGETRQIELRHEPEAMRLVVPLPPG